MSFQTVFFDKTTGRIINVMPDKYIRSKAEKLRLCPASKPANIGFLYFPSSIPIDPVSHHVQFVNDTHPPWLVVSSGIPVVYADRRQPFLELRAKYKTIIVNMDGGLGDNLFRAAAVIEAQKQFPDLKFYCAVYPREYEIMALCPDIDLLPIPDGGLKPLDSTLIAHSLDPAQCGHIILNGGLMWDPRGAGFSKAALYGLFLDLGYVAYNTRLQLPADFNKNFTAFAAKIGVRSDGHNVVLQLRTKGTDDRGWQINQVIELAALIKKAHDCTIFYLGDSIDMPDEHRDIVNLCGKTTYLQTAFILTKASKIICIDSAVLHLCRGLNLPYYCLWGHTDPLRTLGIEPGHYDIGADFGTPKSLMKNITPQQVFDKVFA